MNCNSTVKIAAIDLCLQLFEIPLYRRANCIFRPALPARNVPNLRGGDGSWATSASLPSLLANLGPRRWQHSSQTQPDHGRANVW